MSDEDTTPNPDDPPVVLSPGDSDAPDAPDRETVYPDEQGAPGETRGVERNTASTCRR